MNNIGAFGNSWKEHLVTPKHILTCLQENDITMIILLKWKWGAQEIDWLGYWLTLNGHKNCGRKRLR